MIITGVRILTRQQHASTQVRQIRLTINQCQKEGCSGFKLDTEACYFSYMIQLRPGSMWTTSLISSILLKLSLSSVSVELY